VKDAMIIGACQKVEHYEIAGYGTLCTWAEHIVADRVSQLLGETLSEEKEADQKLTQLAQSAVNLRAAEVGGGTATD
jgi:ferritin-like metal-binding protein YciE